MDADLVIIGGGITGLGISRDAAMRGFKVILLERDELGSGTSGYFHGILHSGARYAVVDPPSAIECWEENQILRNIAKEAILFTGSAFLAFTDEDVKFADKLMLACKRTGIPTDELSVSEILKKEPQINKDLKRAFHVPAGHINGTKTIKLNKDAAEKHGAKILTYSNIKNLVIKDGKVHAAILDDNSVVKAKYFINAGGIWAKKIAAMANINIPLTGYKGSLIVYSEMFSNLYLQRCRMPSDGDLLLPTWNEYIIGTTSIKTENINTHEVEQWEINKLVKEAAVMVPNIANSPIKRVYAGVRPIYTSENVAERQESRSFNILNHESEGLSNFLSVVGGKFMIYRLMAEKAVDSVCANFGVTKTCRTAEVAL